MKLNQALIASIKTAVLLLISLSALANEGVDSNHSFQPDMKTIDLLDESRNRPLKVTVWYPKGRKNDCEALTEKQICLTDKAHKHKVVVLSHGAMGDAMGYNWIGYALASQGFTVLGASHFGESWVYGQQSIDRSSALRLWDRSLDISFILDSFSKEPHLSQALNYNNVAAIGHSAGGFTALSLAGARIGREMKDYCTTPESKGDLGCGYLQHSENMADKEHIAKASYKDSRITSVIALDPAAGPVADVKSLKDIKVATLIIAPKENDFLNHEAHAAYFQKHIPKSRLVSLNDGEGHFIFLDVCDHEYKAMGVSLCKDAHGVNRKQVHEKLYAQLFPFLYAN